MLHGLLHGRIVSASRKAIAATAVVAWSLASPGAALADDAQVTVVTPGGAQQTLSLDALAGSEDVIDRSYALRSSTGESSRAVSGFSLAVILEAAGVDPYGFSHLQAQRPAGGSVLLSRHQALDPGAFTDGPPVVYATAIGTGFLRPSSGEGDLNETDSFEAPQGITLVLGKGSPLKVTAKASTVRARSGVAVDFTAIVEGAGAGEQLTFSWYFDDGHSASRAEARHAFAKRGSYDVIVGVTTPGDRAGASAVVTIQVGAPISGPDRKGGGRNKDANAPDHGAAGRGGAVPPGPVASSPASTTAAKDQPTTDDQKKQVGNVAVGEQVRGLLLSDAPNATPPAEPTAQAAARAGNSSEEGNGTSLPGTAWGLLVTTGLLGLGALTETRHLLR
jgi:PKD domain